MANDTRLKLYKALQNANYNIGSYSDFDRRMNNAEDRRKFYDAVSSKYNIGSFEDFDARIKDSKYRVTVNGVDTPVSEREYKELLNKKKNAQSIDPAEQVKNDIPQIATDENWRELSADAGFDMSGVKKMPTVGEMKQKEQKRAQNPVITSPKESVAPNVDLPQYEAKTDLFGAPTEVRVKQKGEDGMANYITEDGDLIGKYEGEEGGLYRSQQEHEQWNKEYRSVQIERAKKQREQLQKEVDALSIAANTSDLPEMVGYGYQYGNGNVEETKRKYDEKKKELADVNRFIWDNSFEERDVIKRNLNASTKNTYDEIGILQDKANAESKYDLAITGGGKQNPRNHLYGQDRVDWDNYQMSARILNDAQKVVDEVEREGNGQLGAISAIIGIKDAVFDSSTWSQGMSDLFKQIKIKDITSRYAEPGSGNGPMVENSFSSAIAKLDNGKSISKSEEAVLKAVLIGSLVDGTYGENLSKWYKAGKTTGEMFPYMLEMAINPLSNASTTASSALGKVLGKGIGKRASRYFVNGLAANAAKTEAKGAVKSAVKTAVKEKAVAYANEMLANAMRGTVLAGDKLVRGGLMAMTTGAPKVAGGTLEKMNGQLKPVITEDGGVEYGGHYEDTQEDLGTAFAKSLAENTYEYATEMGFGLVGMGLRGAKKALAPLAGKAAPLFSKLTNNRIYNGFMGWTNKLTPTQFVKSVRDFEKATQWHGLFEEYWEEVEGNVMDALTLGNLNFNFDFKDKNSIFNYDMNLETFMGVSLMGGAISVAKALGYRGAVGEARARLDASDKAAEGVFGKDAWAWLKEELDGIDPNGKNERGVSDITEYIIGKMQDGTFTEEGQKAVFDYLHAREFAKGAEIGKKNADMENDDVLARAVNDEVENGAPIEDAGDMHNVGLDNKSDEEALLALPNGESLKNAIDRLIEDGASTGELSALRDGLSDAENDVVERYIQSKTDAMKLQKQIDEEVKSAVDAEREIISKGAWENGVLWVAYLKESGEQVFIDNVDGDNVCFIRRDGKVDIGNINDFGEVSYDEEGNAVFENEQFYENFEDYLNEFEEGKHAEVTERYANSVNNNPNTVTDIAVGKSVMMLNGEVPGEYQVVGQTADGKWNVARLVPQIEDGVMRSVPSTDEADNSIMSTEELIGAQNAYHDAPRMEEMAQRAAVEGGTDGEASETETAEGAEGASADALETETAEGDTTDSGENADITEGGAPVEENRGGITYDEKNNPNFDGASEDEVVEYFNGLDNESAGAFIGAYLNGANKALDEVNQAKPKGDKAPKASDYIGRIGEFLAAKSEWEAQQKSANEEYLQKQEAAQKDVDRWTSIRNKWQKAQADKGMEANMDARAEAKLASEKATLDERDAALGDARSLAEFVERLAYQYKYLWKDKKNGTKGLASHLFANASEMDLKGEREARLAYLRNEGGMTPEEVAHDIAQKARESMLFGQEIDEQEIFDEYLQPCLLSYSNRGDIVSYYEEQRMKEIEDERAEEEAKADAFETETDSSEDADSSAEDFESLGEENAPEEREGVSDEDLEKLGSTFEEDASGESEKEDNLQIDNFSMQLISGNEYIGVYPFGSQLNSVNIGKPKLDQMRIAKNFGQMAESSADFGEFRKKITNGGKGYSLLIDDLTQLKMLFELLKNGKISREQFENAFYEPQYKNNGKVEGTEQKSVENGGKEGQSERAENGGEEDKANLFEGYDNAEVELVNTNEDDKEDDVVYKKYKDLTIDDLDLLVNPQDIDAGAYLEQVKGVEGAYDKAKENLRTKARNEWSVDDIQEVIDMTMADVADSETSLDELPFTKDMLGILEEIRNEKSAKNNKKEEDKAKHDKLRRVTESQFRHWAARAPHLLETGPQYTTLMEETLPEDEELELWNKVVGEVKNFDMSVAKFKVGDAVEFNGKTNYVYQVNNDGKQIVYILTDRKGGNTYNHQVSEKNLLRQNEGKDMPKSVEAPKEKKSETVKKNTEKKETKGVERKLAGLSDEENEELVALKKQLKELMKGGGKLYSTIVPVDPNAPQKIAVGSRIAFLYIKSGIRQFRDFCDNLIEDLGDEIRPYLKSIYNAVRDYPGSEEFADDMTAYDEVRKFDVLEYDKENKDKMDVLDKADEMVAEENVIEEQTTVVEEIVKPIEKSKPKSSGKKKEDGFVGDLFGQPIAPATKKTKKLPKETAKVAPKELTEEEKKAIEERKAKTLEAANEFGDKYGIKNRVAYIQTSIGKDKELWDSFISNAPFPYSENITFATGYQSMPFNIYYNGGKYVHTAYSFAKVEFGGEEKVVIELCNRINYLWEKNNNTYNKIAHDKTFEWIEKNQDAVYCSNGDIAVDIDKFFDFIEYVYPNLYVKPTDVENYDFKNDAIGKVYMQMALNGDSEVKIGNRIYHCTYDPLGDTFRCWCYPQINEQDYDVKREEGVSPLHEWFDIKEQAKKYNIPYKSGAVIITYDGKEIKKLAKDVQKDREGIVEMPKFEGDEVVENVDTTINRLYNTYTSNKEKHPDSFLLFNIDGKYIAFEDEAEHLIEKYGYDSVTPDGKFTKKVEFDESKIDAILPKLVREGLRIGIVHDLEEGVKKNAKAKGNVGADEIKLEEIVEGAEFERETKTGTHNIKITEIDGALVKYIDSNAIDDEHSSKHASQMMKGAFRKWLNLHKFKRVEKKEENMFGLGGEDVGANAQTTEAEDSQNGHYDHERGVIVNLPEGVVSQGITRSSFYKDNFHKQAFLRVDGKSEAIKMEMYTDVERDKNFNPILNNGRFVVNGKYCHESYDVNLKNEEQAKKAQELGYEVEGEWNGFAPKWVTVKTLEDALELYRGLNGKKEDVNETAQPKTVEEVKVEEKPKTKEQWMAKIYEVRKQFCELYGVPYEPLFDGAYRFEPRITKGYRLEQFEPYYDAYKKKLDEAVVEPASEKQIAFIKKLAEDGEWKMIETIPLNKINASYIITILKASEDAVTNRYSTASDFEEFDNELRKVIEMSGGNVVEHSAEGAENGENSVTLQRDETHVRFSRAVAADMLEAVNTGVRPYNSIIDLRKKAKECGMNVSDSGETDILLQELVEDGLVSAARELKENKTEGIWSKEFFDKVCKLYDMQPNISMRSSNRIIMQQYSTPLPMGYLADMFAMRGHHSRNILEPTAGNGMLVAFVPVEKVHANELDGDRLANLKEQGFKKVTNQDATQPFEGGKQYDAVIMNPPFGNASAKSYEGKMISGLDPQIVLNSLDNLNDDGKASIIIGGNLEYAGNGSIKGKKAFFAYLYDHFNVKGIINMDGDLYKKQGTSYPTMMIFIDGRRTNEERAQSVCYPPVKDNARGSVKTFDELFDKVNEIINDERKTDGTELVRSQELAFDTQSEEREGNGKSDSGQHRANDADGRGQNVQGTSANSTNGVRRENGETRPNGRSGRNAESNGGKSNSRRGNELESVPNVGNDGERNGLTKKLDTPKESIIEAKVDKLGEGERQLDQEKMPYKKHNTAFSLQSVAPSSMVEAMDKTLSEIEKEHGSIDEFITKELGYDSVEDAHNALAAEQMDSVAMAIVQMKKGKALIIGDQTGVGKGRQMAALVRWAVKQGKKPVFITQKATLFSDIYRDLVDIGSGDLRPFIFNSDGAMTDNNGKTIYTPMSASAQAKVYESGKLPDDCDYAVITYSQVNTGDAIAMREAEEAKKQLDANERGRGKKQSKAVKEGKPTPKATFLRQLVKDNYVFLDESHTAAGGDSNIGLYFQSILKTVKACTFASATFAKRPDTMALYALKTAMSEANIAAHELIKVIEKGGVTLQEIMSRALSVAGQMVRRERDMRDVVTDWKTIDDPKIVKEARDNYDKTIDAFNAIINFQKTYIDPRIEELNAALSIKMSTAQKKKGTDKMGVANVPFANKTYVYTKQLMLALKAKAIAEEVDKEIKAGRHPVIALESTMEASIKDYADGEVIEEPTFAASLLRGLESTLKYTEKDADGNEHHYKYSLEMLGPDAERAYHELEDKIKEQTKGIYISPLDAVIDELHKMGYNVGELTGRKLNVVQENGKAVVRKRIDKDKKALMRRFNNGELDVLILNKSASTGISLHASAKFSDQRQRTMIIAEPLSDINDYMQMIGRIDRTGQVHRGYYINLGLPVPAENRFLMMLSTKLKSLNANTTTSQDSKSNDVEAPDLLNKYGSRVVVEYLRDHVDVYEKMGNPFKFKLEDGSYAYQLEKFKWDEDTARKVTGYVALLTTKEQEEFYDDVVQRYTNLINYLNDTGENDLKITVMPLRAKTITKKVSSRGKNPKGDNPFAKDAFVEKVEMDVLRKPMKAKEVQSVIESLNNGKMDNSTIRDLQVKISEDADARRDAEEERYNKAVAKFEESFKRVEEKIKANKKIDESEKANIIATQRQEMWNAIEEKHNTNLKNIRDNENLFRKYIAYFSVGESCLMPSTLENAVFSSSSPAIFCGIKAKEKMTPSTTFAVFAILDGRRRIEIPLSQITPLMVIKQHTNENYDSANETSLSNWDEKIPQNARKEGYILTGNIIQAVADTQDKETGAYVGQLISYTDIDGNIHDGILMPESWNPGNMKNAGAPFSSAIKDVLDGNVVSSSDGQVSIRKYAYMTYEVSVPSSQKQGGKYYKNPSILNLVEYGRFYQRNGEFKAQVSEDNIEKLMKALDGLGVRVSEDDAVRFRRPTFVAGNGLGVYGGRKTAVQNDYYYEALRDIAENEELFEKRLAVRNAAADAYRKFKGRKGGHRKAWESVYAPVVEWRSVEDENGFGENEQYGQWNFDEKDAKELWRRIEKPLREYREALVSNSYSQSKRFTQVYQTAIDEVDYALKYYEALANGEDVFDEGWEKPRFARAWHGSSADFDRFDLGFALSGEGNMAYGYGVYVGELKGTGEYYANVAAQNKKIKDVGDIDYDNDILIDGKPVNEVPNEYGLYDMVQTLKNNGLDVNAAIEDLKDSISWLESMNLGDEATKAPKTQLDMLESGRVTTTRQGKADRVLYEVEIPDDNGENYLAWHEELTSEQEDKVADVIFRSLGLPKEKSYVKRYLTYDGGVSFVMNTIDEFDNGSDMRDEWLSRDMHINGHTGGNAYRNLVRVLGSDELASAALSEIGISGIKVPVGYMGGSSDYNGSYNYVVFNDSDVEIVSKTKFRPAELLNMHHSSREMDAMEKAVVDAAERLNVGVKVVRSHEEVDALLGVSKGNKEILKKEGKGLYNTKSGEVIIFLPNNEDKRDAVKTVLHEIVGHKGLRNIVGEENYNRLLAKVYDGMPKEVRSEINKRASEEFEWDVYEATDEYLAEMAEEDVVPSWFDKVVGALRQMLREVGFNLDLSTDDVRYLLWQSRNRLERGDIVGEAESRVMRERLGISRRDAQRGRAENGGRASANALETDADKGASSNKEEGDVRFSLRKKEAPKVTKKGYAVFVVRKDKKSGRVILSPKMLKETKVGVPAFTWLDSDTGMLKRDADGNPIQNARGRAVVSVNGSQSGGKDSNKLSWRPGKHLAVYTNAAQFASTKDGMLDDDVVFFEVEYSADPMKHLEYQYAAWEYGMQNNGKYINDWGGVPFIPEDSYYIYRTNGIADGATPMIITGSYRITRALTDAEAKEMNEKAGGKWIPRRGGELTAERLAEIGIDEEGLRRMSEEFDTSAIAPHHDESDEARVLPGYVRRRLNFDDPNLIHAIEENYAVMGEDGISLEEYRDMYDENGGPDGGGKPNVASAPERGGSGTTIDMNGKIRRKGASMDNSPIRIEVEIKSALAQLVDNIKNWTLGKIAERTFRKNIAKIEEEISSIVEVKLFGIGVTEKELVDFGYSIDDAREIKSMVDVGFGGYYDVDMKKVIIFAQPKYRNDINSIMNMYAHENFHAFVDILRGNFENIDDIIDRVYKDKKILAKYIKIRASLELKDKYGEPYYEDDEKPEEFLTYIVGNGVADGTIEEVLNSVDDETRKVIEQYLKFIGYDKSKANRQGTASNLRKGHNQLSAEERNTEQTNKEGRRKGIVGTLPSGTDVEEKERMGARAMYEKELGSNMFKFQEAWQDSMLGLKKAMESVMKAEGKTFEDVADWENAYIAENLMSSVNDKEFKMYRELAYKPILKAVKVLEDAGESRDDINYYLFAKHGLERNAWMLRKKVEDALNAEFGDEIAEAQKKFDEGLIDDDEFQAILDDIKMRKEDREIELMNDYRKDFSGLTALTSITANREMDDIAEIEDEAKRIVDEFEGKHDTADLWDAINNATKAQVTKQYESGLITEDVYNDLMRRYKNYIPLRGFDETTSDEVYDYLAHSQSPMNDPIKKANGRKSLADDPIATIGNMAESGIMAANRNMMKQKLLNFVENHRSNLFSLNEVHVMRRKSASGEDEWVAIGPAYLKLMDITKHDATQKEFEAWFAQMAENEPENYKMGKDAKEIPYRVLPKFMGEHIIDVKRGGRSKVITVNGDPRVAQAINGLTNPDSVKGMLKTLTTATNIMARLNTTFSPAFVMANLSRDGIYANSLVWAKESPAYAVQFHKNWGKSMANVGRLIRKFNKSKLDMSNDMERMFYEFMTNGGETGQTRLTNVEQYKGVMQDALDDMRRKGWNPKNIMLMLGNALEIMNQWAEDTTRFAAYMTSRQMGRSQIRSAYDAKEISVNFNKKGAGASTSGNWEKGNRKHYISSQLAQMVRPWFMFFNAGVQGMYNVGRVANKHKGKFASIAFAYFGLGMLAPFIAAACGGDDDDDYWNLPEYVRRQNMCIYVGSGYVKIPLPIELRAIYGLGDIVAGQMLKRTHYDGKELASNVGAQMGQVLPIDFIGEGGMSLVPSVVRPLTEAFITNKDWTGMPIYKDSDFMKYAPNWTKAYSKTDPTIVEFCEWMNETTGGNKYKKGGVDLNPAIIEHLYNGYLGGMGTFFSQSKRTIGQVFGEEELNARNVPVFNRFYAHGDERMPKRRIDNEWYRNKEKMDAFEAEINGFKKDLKLSDPVEVADAVDNYIRLKGDDMNAKYELWKEYDKNLEKLRKQMKVSDSEVVEDVMYEIKKMMNEVMYE